MSLECFGKVELYLHLVTLFILFEPKRTQFWYAEWNLAIELNSKEEKREKKWGNWNHNEVRFLPWPLALAF